MALIIVVYTDDPDGYVIDTDCPDLLGAAITKAKENVMNGKYDHIKNRVYLAIQDDDTGEPEFEYNLEENEEWPW